VVNDAAEHTTDMAQVQNKKKSLRHFQVQRVSSVRCRVRRLIL
jgi:hypothetical protein